MRICLAQTRPIRGDIQHNIENHMKVIDVAVSHHADMVVFSELSITGYEPTLAKELATDMDDRRFDGFQKIADSNQMTIGIGVPTRNDGGLNISMVLFQPGRTRQIYSKEYIHADEEPFFVSGQNSIGLIGGNNRIALAICYELSIPAHSEKAFKTGAKIYLASVAKTANGVANANQTLSEIASRYSMTVLLCNCVGPCDNFQAGGRSAIWNDKGELVAQLDDANEGILMIDTETNAVTKRQSESPQPARHCVPPT